MFFFSKNRLQILSLRMGKHCIGKKSEHRPSLQLSNECCQDHILIKNIWFVWFGGKNILYGIGITEVSE